MSALGATGLCRVEGIHTVLRDAVLVMGRPREIVVRRVPASVVGEEVDGLEVEGGQSSPVVLDDRGQVVGLEGYQPQNR